MIEHTHHREQVWAHRDRPVAASRRIEKSARNEKNVRWPVSRVLYPCGRWPFLWDVRCRTPRATNPGGVPETGLTACADMPPLFGLAPGGVCRAAPVSGSAVGSYPTLSPLPRHHSGLAAALKAGRSAFCGTFPEVALAGACPAPSFRGARTFLARRLSTIARAAARPTGTAYKGVRAPKRKAAPRDRRGQPSMTCLTLEQ